MSGLLLLPPIPTQAPLQDSAGNLTPAWVAWFLSVATLLQAPVNGGSLTNVPIESVATGSQVAGFTMADGAYLREGQTAYDTGSAGFWLGVVAAVAKFSLGDPAGAALLWDGLSLMVRAADILLSSANVYTASAALKFARETGDGFTGVGDRNALYTLGVGGVPAGGTETSQLVLENTMVGTHNGAGGTQGDAQVDLIATGWQALPAVAAHPASLVLISRGSAAGASVADLTADILNLIGGWNWQAFVPVLGANVGTWTVGSGSLDCNYAVIGDLVTVQMQIDNTTLSGAPTSLTFTLPVASLKGVSLALPIFWTGSGGWVTANILLSAGSAIGTISLPSGGAFGTGLFWRPTFSYRK